MSHVPTSLSGPLKPASPPDRSSEYRCAMWCEYPDEAYAALMDALYRPQVSLELSPLTFPVLEPPKSIILKISAPYFIHGKSKLDINIEIKDHDKLLKTYTPDQDVIEGCEVESGRYEFVYKIPQGDSIGLAQMSLLTFTAKIRLDLLGDNKMQFPYEPMFCGTNIENKSDEKTVKGLQLPTDSKWIVAETEFPCNYSKHLRA
jgi:hypothetical protein